ncbi:CapA family protein [Salinispora mooreana]|uniref:CapA family protein n=1 Tax=Salinispora mooreana TaxID=999545 RepID=UPI00036A300E|nr:CapA family protein [Salinispora mooreana]
MRAHPNTFTFAGHVRRLLSAGALLAVLAVAGCGAAGSGGAWQPGVSSSAPTPSPTEAAAVSLTATGDIILGNAPNRLPPGGGEGFFDEVRPELAADLAMGNLEEPLTVDTGTGKCGEGSTNCYQFRAPPEYAAHLRDGGFDLLNLANNHGNDFGAKGLQNTRQALEQYELAHTGAPDQITVVDVRGVRVAVAGFSSYAWSNPLTDIPAAKQVVTRAAEMADLVVVQVHMGAEGADKTQVKPGTELYLGENRGDPVRFAKAMIDAGADLIVGHGPHVLRGMEFYQGRLIAYSLGNFAGGGNTLSRSGRLGWGGVLKVSLQPDGTWDGGSFASTHLNGSGLPAMDPDDRGLGLVRELSAADFPETGAIFDDLGQISQPQPS